MRLPRRTKRQRQEERIEAAEHARRVRDGDPLDSVLCNPSVKLPDPVVTAAQAEYRRTLRELQRASREATPGLHPVVCWRHQWKPAPRAPGLPQPPASHCPMCREEWAVRGQNVTGHYFSDGAGPQREIPMSPEAEALYEQKLQEREARGEVVAGRDSEDVALERIDELRQIEEDELAEQQRRADWYREHRGDLDAVYTPKRRRRRTTRERAKVVARWRDEFERTGRIIVDA